MKRPLILLSLLLALILTGCGVENPQTSKVEVKLSQTTGTLKFPTGFLWGASSSSYQVEGGVNDGSRGYANADFLVHTANMAQGENADVAIDDYHRYPETVAALAKGGIKSYRFSIAWERIYPSGSPYELSASGTPILNGDGNPVLAAPNADGIAYYNNLINALIANKITPIITLFHWDMPISVFYTGGFHNRNTVNLYAGYAQACFLAFGDRVTTWITMNEPWSFGVGLEGLTQLTGEQAPALLPFYNNVPLDYFFGGGMSSLHHYFLAHARAVQIYRQLEASGQIKPGKIGMAFDMHLGKPATSSASDMAAAEISNELNFDWFLYPFTRGYYPPTALAKLRTEGFDFDDSPDQINADLAFIKQQGFDFIGYNYYTRWTITSVPNTNSFPLISPGVGSGAIFKQAYLYQPPVSPGDTPPTLGPYDPQGLYDALMAINKEAGNVPIYITENGANYKGEDVLDNGAVHDSQRQRYLLGHVRAAWQASHDGVDLRGYSIWGLNDDFEWGSGYHTPFGLVFVDFTQSSLPRYMKDSFYWYQGVAAANGVPAN